MKAVRSIVALSLLMNVTSTALAETQESINVPHEARAGQSVTVSVKTQPNAKCRIEAQDAGMTQALKLFDKDADRNGKASWTFDIPKDYKANKMPIVITVDKNGKQMKEVRDISIKK